MNSSPDSNAFHVRECLCIVFKLPQLLAETVSANLFHFQKWSKPLIVQSGVFCKKDPAVTCSDICKERGYLWRHCRNQSLLKLHKYLSLAVFIVRDQTERNAKTFVSTSCLNVCPLLPWVTYWRHCSWKQKKWQTASILHTPVPHHLDTQLGSLGHPVWIFSLLDLKWQVY